MAATYGFVKEQEIKSIIWYDADTEGAVPTPIAMFPPSIPDETISAICKLLAAEDPEGKYAAETDKYIESTMAPQSLDSVLGEVSVGSAESNDQSDVSPSIQTEDGTTTNDIPNGTDGATGPGN